MTIYLSVTHFFTQTDLSEKHVVIVASIKMITNIELSQIQIQIY